MTAFESLFDDVQLALQRYKASVTLARDDRSTDERVSRASQRLDAFDEVRVVRTSRTLPELAADIRDGRPLSSRELRFVAQAWVSFDESTLALFIDRYPSSQRLLRAAFLAQFDVWQQRSDLFRQHATQRIDRFESEHGVLVPSVRFARLVTQAGIDELANRLTTQPHRYGEALRALSLRDRWAYTSHVRAAVLARELETRGAAATLDYLGGRPEAERQHVLPPPRANTARSAFFAQSNAVSLMALWLRRANAEASASERVDELVVDALGDPLGVAQQQDRNVWGALERDHAAEYQGLVQRITRSDIEFFFKNVEGDDAHDRAKFWLRYLRSIRKTKTFLDTTHRTMLKWRADSTGDPTQRMALGRAGTLKGGAGASTSAFVLWFDAVVCVEFSTSGNASYLYSRHAFERLGLANARSLSASELKQRDVGEQMRHNPRGAWLIKFEQRLYANGIRPDRW